MASLRVYLHYGDRFTWLYVGSGDTAVADVARQFARAHAERFPAAGLAASRLELRGASGSPLPLQSPLRDAVRDGDDVTVLRLAAEAPPTPTPTPAPAEQPAAARPAPPQPAAGAPEVAPAEARQLLQRATQLAAQKQLRDSSMIYEQVLQSLGSDKAPLARDCFLGLAANASAIERHDRAASLLRRGVDAFPKDVRLLTRLGDTLCCLGQPGDAVRVLELALTSRRAGARGADGAGAAGATPVTPPLDSEHDIMAVTARALYAHGAKDAGAALVMRVLRESDEKHPAALLEYARVSLDQGRPPDALTVLLRLLAASPQRHDLREELARAASEPEGVRALLQQLDATGQSLATALAFVAAAVKDGGGVVAAAQLSAKAAALLPRSAAHALAHCHALEAAGRPGAALDALAAFFEANAATPLGGSASLGQLAPLLRGAPRLPGDTRPGAAGYEGFLADAMNAELPDTATAAAACATALPAWPASGVPPESGGETYAPDALDALAAGFCAVKLLFAAGCVRRAAAVAAVAERARAASRVPLHTTHIRNEAAYYACVAALMRDFPVAAPPAPLPVYLLGDSHVLAAAWRRVPLSGQQRLLVPALVTGVKAWHLRPGCRFYPAKHWAAAAARLPDGADVVACVGEIDCREGLLLAVARGRYDSLPAAAAGTAALLVAELQRLAAQRRFTLYVHPVPPVLDVTRPLVRLLNAALRDAVRATASAATPAPARLRWLELQAPLLADDGAGSQGGNGGLRPEYALDGTHLSPRYVELLAMALHDASQ